MAYVELENKGCVIVGRAHNTRPVKDFNKRGILHQAGPKAPYMDTACRFTVCLQPVGRYVEMSGF